MLGMLLKIAIGGCLLAVAAGVYAMARGRASNQMMQWRIALQMLAVGVLTLLFFKGIKT